MMNLNFVCCYVTYPAGQGATTQRDPTTTDRTTRRTSQKRHRWPRKRLHAPRWATGAT